MSAPPSWDFSASVNSTVPDAAGFLATTGVAGAGAWARVGFGMTTLTFGLIAEAEIFGLTLIWEASILTSGLVASVCDLISYWSLLLRRLLISIYPDLSIFSLVSWLRTTKSSAPGSSSWGSSYSWVKAKSVMLPLIRSWRFLYIHFSSPKIHWRVWLAVLFFLSTFLISLLFKSESDMVEFYRRA